MRVSSCARALARMARSPSFGSTAGALFLLLIPGQSPAWAQALTLEHAWQRAEQLNPEYRAALAELQAAEGQLADTRAPLWNNPELTGDLARRSEPGGTAREWGVGVAQTLEIARQQRHRREAAERDLTALRERLADAYLQLRAEVERRFVRVLGLQLRVETEAEAVKLIEDAASAVDKRLKAGEDTRLERNLSRVEADRARNQLAQLGEQLTQARAELAAAIQLPPDQLPQVSGTLDTVEVYTLQQLLDAVRGRPLLRALVQHEEAAQARLRLERASVYPDVTVGVGVSREGLSDARERITGITVGLPLPLFRRNATGIGRATSDLVQAQVEREATVRDVQARLHALWEQRESLRRRMALLNTSVLPNLKENQRLSVISYRAGAIGLLELLLANRQLVDGHRDALEAATDLRLTQIDLKATAGFDGIPPGALSDPSRSGAQR